VASGKFFWHVGEYTNLRRGRPSRQSLFREVSKDSGRDVIARKEAPSEILEMESMDHKVFCLL